MKISISLNDTVRVKLTDQGRLILAQEFERLALQYPNLPLWKEKAKEARTQEVVETELWNLMNQFGNHLFHGCIPPFMEIEVLSK